MASMVLIYGASATYHSVNLAGGRLKIFRKIDHMMIFVLIAGTYTPIMLSSFVAFRQVYLFIMSRVCNEIIPIAMSYPAGWILCATLTTIYFHRVKLGSTRLVDDIPTKEKE